MHRTLEYKLLTENTNNPLKKRSIHVKWHKPPKGWYKFNIDASYNKNQPSGLGGVFRSTNSSWILGFTKATYTNGALESERLTLLEGLTTAQEWNLFPLEIETDCIQIVNAPDEGRDPQAQLQAGE
ncbi:uncharacterized protein [Nicotiana sylvestris]|uniref:Uncharacterized protein LOC104242461 n=1 Tax=Nicotiana sylvestris TaxID=4096 RepID=A0A1U7YAI0_NICSY|nr:PREDICTED: uncharacterized protein LOC104242461 [Nicotiana sylvestris]